MKKIAIFLIILLSLAFSKLPLKEFFYTSLVKLHILKRCYDRSNDFSEIFTQEGLNYEVADKRITAASLAKLLEQEDAPLSSPKIPLITHHIYLTSIDSPVKLNDFYIEKMKVNFTKLNSLSKNWQHYIWTTRADIIPNEIKAIKGVQLKEINDLKGHFLFQELVNIVDKANISRPYFAEAADLLRLMAIQKFGGIYNDMDYEIYDANALLAIMRRFDFIGGREMSTLKSYYGNAFIAARPNHPVINEALKINLRNYGKTNAPDYIKYPCKESIRIYYNGPPLITIAYFLKNNIDGNSDIILPSWMVFNAHFARFKNNICDYSKISPDEFKQNNTNLANLITEFTTHAKIEGGESDDLDVQNIYYSTKYHNELPIIGADMFCGNWIIGNQFKRNYHWNW